MLPAAESRNRSVRIGVVSDIHCNIRGLRTALTAMGPIDQLLCLGDSIYEYRFSNEVVALLRELGAHVVQGNHEEIFFGPLGERARSQPWIDPSLMRWLAERPKQIKLTLAGKTILLVHSTPWSPRGTYVYPGSPLLRRFGEVDADFVLYGHTHMQLAERVGRPLVINPGSAGEARDSRRRELLSCAVIDLATDSVEFIDYPDLALQEALAAARVGEKSGRRR
jgi:putative phosphoesterase